VKVEKAANKIFLGMTNPVGVVYREIRAAGFSFINPGHERSVIGRMERGEGGKKQQREKKKRSKR